MGDRAVYCARLESVCAERHPGFESPPIRQLTNGRLIADVIWFCSARQEEIRTPLDRWGALRAGVKARPSNRSQSAALDNPAHPPRLFLLS